MLLYSNISTQRRTIVIAFSVINNQTCFCPHTRNKEKYLLTRDIILKIFDNPLIHLVISTTNRRFRGEERNTPRTSVATANYYFPLSHRRPLLFISSSSRGANRLVYRRSPRIPWWTRGGQDEERSLRGAGGCASSRCRV